MNVVYLCLTCFKTSAEEKECHQRPMIRCEAPRPGAPPAEFDLHPQAPPWLLQTLYELERDQAEKPETQHTDSTSQ